MFIVKKTINNNDYFYLRDSKRVDGKVKATTIAYLGKDRKEAEKKAASFMKNLKDKKFSKKSTNEAMKNTKKHFDKKDFVEEKEFISFIQEAGLIWGPSPEIYGGMAGFFTYGPLGKSLKNKVENSVRRIFNSEGFRELEGPTILPDVVWKASGHLETFSDPIILTKDGSESYRVDKLLEDKGIKIEDFDNDKLLELIKKHKIVSPSGKPLQNKIKSHSLMMKTKVAGKDSSLRPETATVTYLPFPRLYQYFRKNLPFGVYQIGKAYRNEISPRQHVLRGREFTQAEGQIFIDPEKKNDWEKFEEISSEVLPFWEYKLQDKNKEPMGISVEVAVKKKIVKSKAYVWCLWLAYKQFRRFGVPKDRIRLRQHSPSEMAFYANDAWDIEVKLNNYGWVEMCGVHDRGDYDLKQHSEGSGIKLEAIRENGERFIPHILEIAFGIDRPTYALMDIFYDKKSVEDGKSMFKIPYCVAPIDLSVFPLMKKPELVRKALEVKENLENDFVVNYDKSGSIGKRYLRSAISGVPYCITIDYDSLEKDDVTIRDRDTEKQVRVKILELNEILRKLFNEKIKFEDLEKHL
ncbi:glycine--tRNA ligase [Candidatus Parvarchaeota archaeon]|nr:MAG: glycine--tRNA ligase [Candidatus Parvarchaeota archaeon]